MPFDNLTPQTKSINLAMLVVAVLVASGFFIRAATRKPSNSLCFQPDEFLLEQNKKSPPRQIEDSCELVCIHSDTPHTPSIWYKFFDLLINTELFKVGIILLVPSNEEELETKVPATTVGLEFPHTSRTLVFGHFKDQPKRIRASKAVNKLMEPLTSYSASGDGTTFTQHYTAVYTKERHAEIFVPLIISSDPQKGYYVYPWLSKNFSNIRFSGFTKFVTAGCMFGSLLRGIDQLGISRPLIKHDISFYSEQKIIDIVYNPDEANAFEAATFAELVELTYLMKDKTQTNHKPKLLFHLPYYDYMLFGVGLFLKNRITLSALNKLFKEILLKKERYCKELEAIGEAAEIELTIATPFENLFGDLKAGDSKKYELALTILGILKIDANIHDNLLFDSVDMAANELEAKVAAVHPATDLLSIAGAELACVNLCIELLQKNNFNSAHRQLWQDFFGIDGLKAPTTIEELFRISNAHILALAAKNNPEYKTCSVLPLSEKQIQLQYQAISARLNYPAVFNITVIDPIISFSRINNGGLLFYFQQCNSGTLSKLIGDGIIAQAHIKIAELNKAADDTLSHNILYLTPRCGCEQ